MELWWAIRRATDYHSAHLWLPTLASRWHGPQMGWQKSQPFFRFLHVMQPSFDRVILRRFLGPCRVGPSASRSYPAVLAVV